MTKKLKQAKIGDLVPILRVYVGRGGGVKCKNGRLHIKPIHHISSSVVS